MKKNTDMENKKKTGDDYADIIKAMPKADLSYGRIAEQEKIPEDEGGAAPAQTAPSIPSSDTEPVEGKPTAERAVPRKSSKGGAREKGTEKGPSPRSGGIHVFLSSEKAFNLKMLSWAYELETGRRMGYGDIVNALLEKNVEDIVPSNVYKTYSKLVKAVG